MSPLRCNTVREALWERAASAGPAALSPAFAEHLAGCGVCSAERRAVRELIDATRALPDPEVPDAIWDGFDEELGRSIARDRQARIAGHIAPWTRRAAGIAAVLVVGFGLGVLATRGNDRAEEEALAARRAALLADVRAALGNDARLESYVGEIEDLLVEYRANEHGDNVETFRQSLPATMVAGPGVPSEADRERLERQRAAREQLRAVVLGMLAEEVEVESRGFDYLDRRIAEIAGQQLLYFVR